MINTANTPNTTISFSRIVRSTLSIVSPAQAHMSSTLPGVISETFISKLASLILLLAQRLYDNPELNRVVHTINAKSIFFIA
jgi:hypothetical protein